VKGFGRTARRLDVPHFIFIYDPRDHILLEENGTSLFLGEFLQIKLSNLMSSKFCSKKQLVDAEVNFGLKLSLVVAALAPVLRGKPGRNPGDPPSSRLPPSLKLRRTRRREKQHGNAQRGKPTPIKRASNLLRFKAFETILKPCLRSL